MRTLSKCDRSRPATTSRRCCALAAAALLLLPAALAQVPQRLTSGSGRGERHPVLALDGETVAYTAMTAGGREVFTVGSAGGPSTQRTTNAEVRVGWSTFDHWPSLSISDDGNVIAYWNARGVHALDVAANNDVLVATEALLPYPQVDGRGGRVVYQGRVLGQHEVFVVDVANPVPRQITTASGPGRRLPHIRGDRVVFQKLVSGQHEVFLYDLGTNTLVGQLSRNSGGGNRYARLTPDGTAVVYEATVAGQKEVMQVVIATGTITRLTTAALRGDRLPQPTLDGEAFFELPVVNPEVHVLGPAVQQLTTGTLAGLRRAATDRHGHAVVFQADDGAAVEVYVLRRCWPVDISYYGVHGTPSVGALADFDLTHRCTITFGLDTSLAQGTPGVSLVGTQQTAIPLPNAPGNFLYNQPFITFPISLDANGDVALTLNAPTTLMGFALYAQWGLIDLPANLLGIVTSRGVKLDLR
jgi:Tol biopolymer transport system component